MEAALIVGIIAAFLTHEGRRDSLRYVWMGVGTAIAICVAIAVGLELLNRELPHSQQEGLEAVIGLAAVGIVTFMIVWMRRHARGMKADLQDSAAAAIARGSAWALISMAFFAVLREGIETVVFLLAVFQGASDPAAAGIGALLGLAAAAVIGFLIYRGGVKLNLARFFKLTAVVLVFVAAGLLSSVAHSSWEAGWLTALQGQAVDLSWMIVPGTWTSALITGMLGLQSKMTQAETLLYLLYLVPMLAYVLWPESWRLRALRDRFAHSSRTPSARSSEAPGGATTRSVDA